ncbi:hypothetical protein [Spirochaeta isovalerica]|uniref:Methyl-accepting chemotaxis protein n=1 Tax=Spirochaeta isovalerica TaxID=150 RepID=A0A841R8H6_9SPIO|nr:hypothetical protein [Spirochaeta isovalerica]MBB6480193.1 hypothetical protein [Spirochaeta isovalerica]
MFDDLKETIEISNNAVKRIEDIYNISEDLKVFAINSIVYSQREGTRGKGYQIISSRFISLSEEIAKGTTVINGIGKKMNNLIGHFLTDIDEYEEFNHKHIHTVSTDSQKLMEVSGNSVENFSMILGDLLSRIENIKKPTYNIMIQLQTQDIIQQQMDHLSEILEKTVRITEDHAALLNSGEEDLKDFRKLDEYKNINTLLIFLLNTTEKQMKRINSELLSMLDRLEIEFRKINELIRDVDSDKEMISSLVQSENGRDSEATVIHIIFQAPKNTIRDIIANLESSRQRKKDILSRFRGIYELVLSERSVTSEFIPVIESINNLLLLARIEQARNNLDVTSDLSGSDVFSDTAFSDLEGIIGDMDESGDRISENLETVNSIFNKQQEEYTLMEEDLYQSSNIIETTEQLFTENFNSVMKITDALSGEIRQYSVLFSRLRELHQVMDSKISLCDELLDNINGNLEPYGGPLKISECTFKDTTIQEILQNLTVDEERTTIAGEYSELDIEKSTGSNITLF